MTSSLNDNLVIQRLASDLGLRPTADPVARILAYCHSAVTKHLTGHGRHSNVSSVLELLANKLGTRFVEVHSDGDIKELTSAFVARGELIFATLESELDADTTYGITIRLLNAKHWEPGFISIIDCRGSKSSRRYHTKWHELGHLLIQTDQARLAYRRSHDPQTPKPAEESLVDIIAGEFSFYPPILEGHLGGDITFEKIDSIKADFCPDASAYSAIMNLAKMWPSPCVWIEAKLGLKASEKAGGQSQFGFQEPISEALRATSSHANGPAREIRLSIIRNFRVPSDSIVNLVFSNRLTDGAADENLSMWTSSDGHRLPDRPVHVQARRIGGSVHALFTPIIPTK